MPFERIEIFAESVEWNCEIDAKFFQLSKFLSKTNSPSSCSRNLKGYLFFSASVVFQTTDAIFNIRIITQNTSEVQLKMQELIDVCDLGLSTRL